MNKRIKCMLCASFFTMGQAWCTPVYNMSNNIQYLLETLKAHMDSSNSFQESMDTCKAVLKSPSQELDKDGLEEVPQQINEISCALAELKEDIRAILTELHTLEKSSLRATSVRADKILKEDIETIKATRTNYEQRRYLLEKIISDREERLKHIDSTDPYPQSAQPTINLAKEVLPTYQGHISALNQRIAMLKGEQEQCQYFDDFEIVEMPLSSDSASEDVDAEEQPLLLEVQTNSGYPQNSNFRKRPNATPTQDVQASY